MTKQELDKLAKIKPLFTMYVNAHSLYCTGVEPIKQPDGTFESYSTFESNLAKEICDLVPEVYKIISQQAARIKELEA